MAILDKFRVNGTDYDLRDAASVRFNEAQSLTDQQKAAARGNISAADAAAVAALGNRVTDAEADIDALEAGKVEIADMVSRYAGRKMSFLGDSISTFNAEGYKIDGYNMYYPRGDVDSVEDTWFKQVLDGSGTVIEVNASWSGSRVTNTHPNASYPDFYQRCGLLGNPDVIFVALGTNDSSNNIALGDYDFDTATASLSEATFRTAYIKGVKALQANYPNAEIVLLIMSMGNGYADSIRSIGTVLGAQVVDCRGYQGSGVHPGAAGMRWIASRVLYPVDGGLTVAGMAADAAAVRTALAERDEALAGKVAVQQGSGNAGKALVVGADGNVTTGDAGIPDAVKVSLLDLVRHVAYIDDQGQAYYDALYAALYGGSGGYPRLEAVYAPGDHVVYTDDALDTLRPYLTVKRRESAQDSGTVVTDYTLSGTLVDGMSTVLVRKDGLATAVQVESVDYFNQSTWSYPGNLIRFDGGTGVKNDSPAYWEAENPPARASFWAERGLAGQPSAVSARTAVPCGDKWPIPVPENATSVRATIEPSSYYVNIRQFNYDAENNTWTDTKTETGWKQTTANYALLDSDKLRYITVGSKFNSDGTGGTLPTGITVEFE